MNFTEEEKETLAILADKGLSEELLKRRKDVIVEMKKGELISEEDLFSEQNGTEWGTSVIY